MLLIPENIRAVMVELIGHNIPSYLVGGCVRDFLMGRQPKDYDITTPALAEDIKRALPDCKIIDTGIKHGTVTVIYKDTTMEVTTFRRDGEYTDNRHPDQVYFTDDLTEDLSRRDFTINAVAYSPKSGLVDIFGGAQDIKNKTIRTVGEANCRFGEDALRILRAMRFSSDLGFGIEQSASQAMFKLKDNLNYVSKERQRDELCKMLVGSNIFNVLVKYREIIGVIIPEMVATFDFDQRNHNHVYDVFTHTAKSVASVPPVLELRLAMLLHDIGKPSSFVTDKKGVGHFYGHPKKSVEIAEKVLKELRFDNKTKDNVIKLIKFHDVRFDETKVQVKKLLKILGSQQFDNLIEVMLADISAQSPSYFFRKDKIRKVKEMKDEIINSKEPYNIAMLNVTGKDMSQLGINGEDIGKVLDFMLQLSIEEKVENEKGQLIKAAATWKTNQKI